MRKKHLTGVKVGDMILQETVNDKSSLSALLSQGISGRGGSGGTRLGSS